MLWCFYYASGAEIMRRAYPQVLWDVIRKEAWPFYRTIPGVRLCWELEEPKGPKGALVFLLHSHGLFLAPHTAMISIERHEIHCV